jgi:hypothetical protein
MREVPLATLTLEIGRLLEQVDGAFDDSLFNAGAIAALLWLRDGGAAPSEAGIRALEGPRE